MIKIASTNFPIRIVEKTDCFYLFNTKTFGTIYLDEESIKIFEYVRDKVECTETDLEEYSLTNGVSQDDLENLINFLESNKFISVITEV
ncbi:hypothetical protein [Clostridium butanoliproducens]|uniref:hypothetical protein n=1 Tax=Clostridium butanoliproducens TaxID=2991837 RepID=UPI0024B880BB|nr:hypothetical protein [Clostridium butanoliproducens]MDU1348773.1 hypothetical protein [Clostridium argentinense]